MNAAESSGFEDHEDGRLRYDGGHWARSGDRREALTQYLQLAERPYNRTKFQQFLDLAGDVAGKRILDYGGGRASSRSPTRRPAPTSPSWTPRRTR